MIKNKLFNMSLIILIGIALITIVGIVLWKTTFPSPGMANPTSNPGVISADDLEKYGVETETITTNLSTGDYVVVQFHLQTDGKKAKKELEKRSAEVKSAVISTLSSMKPEDLSGEEGLNRLEAALMNRLNENMQEGKVIRVLTIDFKIS